MNDRVENSAVYNLSVGITTTTWSHEPAKETGRSALGSHALRPLNHKLEPHFGSRRGPYIFFATLYVSICTCVNVSLCKCFIILCSCKPLAI